jgi:uncharacterized membrane protein YphA (DoxX/SURF4 family)
VVQLQKLFSIFPDGWPGIGLLLLRFAIGISATTEGAHTLMEFSGATFATWAMGLVAICAGAALLIGFLTPVASALATIGHLAMGLSLLAGSMRVPTDKAYGEIYLVVMSLAVMLLGPGAFSVDARFFGRREIVIPKSHPPSWS